MAWQNGYYYRKRRRGDTVISEYIGAGVIAELIAQYDELERQKRQEEREAFTRLMTEQNALDSEIDDLGAVVRDLVAWALIVAGYRTHRRQWRKDKSMEAIQVQTPAELDITAAELNKLMAAVDSGKPTKAQRATLAAYYERFPALAKMQGDATTVVTNRLIKSLYGKPNGAGAMAANACINDVKHELGYDDAPMLEQLLIEHIVVCWLRLQSVEWCNLNHTEGAHSTSDGAYWDKRLSAAQRRYLRACETLARVRRLNVKIQVNMANQQIVNG